MIDPLSLASAFATIVGLVGQWRSGREGALSIESFERLMQEAGLSELLDTVKQSQVTMVSVKALLSARSDQLLELYSGLSTSIDAVASKIDGLADIASGFEALQEGVGGEGGSARASGTGARAIAGDGGRGGRYGRGGAGGGAVVDGDGSLAVAGNGGDAGGADGSGGRGARIKADLLDMPTVHWGVGRGGRGVDHPTYIYRINMLRSIKAKYFEVFPEDEVYIDACVEMIPVEWFNRSLKELGEDWRVTIEDGLITLPPLP